MDISSVRVETGIGLIAILVLALLLLAVRAYRRRREETRPMRMIFRPRDGIRDRKDAAPR
ncbi:hypothetical protein [Sphingosinicella sp. YJ22]|uniref:hypothetical protein n=1 Tax=Sphingosinicella sp. YJ22 TaxID=1104780 RepID=UPI0014080B4E|nr:hypothetical protein [Sphingosinicella sp. YJ22]